MISLVDDIDVREKGGTELGGHQFLEVLVHHNPARYVGGQSK